MSLDGKIADQESLLATTLFRSGCLRFGTFKIKTGESSPYYIDLTFLLSSPSNLDIVTDLTVRRIKVLQSSNRIDKLASIELKGALLLPTIAQKLNLPSVVVRKTAKNYGVTGRIAGGIVNQGEHFLFFDDVISKGKSKLEGIKPLEQLGAHVNHVMVLIDREQGGKKALENLGYNVHAMSTITELTNNLRKNSYISNEQEMKIRDHVRKSLTC